jgi:hypothetical protein
MGKLMDKLRKEQRDAAERRAKKGKKEAGEEIKIEGLADWGKRMSKDEEEDKDESIADKIKRRREEAEAKIERRKKEAAKRRRSGPASAKIIR